MFPEVSRSAKVGTLASSSNFRYHQNLIYFDLSKLVKRRACKPGGGRGAARSEVTEPSVSAETERALGGEGLVARSVVIDPVLNE